MKKITNISKKIALFISAIFLFNFAWGQENQIELIHADKVTNSIEFFDAVKVKGNVQFKNQDIKLFCDSAFFHKTDNWVRAYGRVQINQGDTLNLYSDSLFFDGNTNIGKLQSKVKIRDKTFKLNTDSLSFDANQSIAYYSNYAFIKSTQNDLTLESTKGTYNSLTKTFTFKDSVKLLHPDYSVYSDTLEFNTLSEVIQIHGPSKILSDSSKIFTKKAIYQTKTDDIQMWDETTIHNPNQTIKGDSILYNSLTEYAEGFGNILLIDSLEKITLSSNYLYKKDSLIKLIGKAKILQYQSTDTLAIRADTIIQTGDRNKNNTVNIAYSNVILEKSGSLGICDSLFISQKDSIIKMKKSPILWKDNMEVSADSITMKLENDAIKNLYLYQNAFLSMEHDSLHYDQCAGKKMIATLDSGKVKLIEIIDNAETIYFPSETSKDSITQKEIKTLKGANYMISSKIYIYFLNEEISRIKFTEEPDAIFKPLKNAKQEDLFLKKFVDKKSKKPDRLLKKID
ncbi:OstA-like protein [Putridiphycobacter roseus]|uniref:OstA-like protein n=1 Tax=Putridiphycobacter roseus TaxID=2219161 RepID=UPI001314FA71